MANETPQFKEAQPIIQPVKVESAAEGYNEFARALGSISQEAATASKSLYEEKSDAMFTQSVADIENLKTKSMIRIAQNPGSANRVATDMKAATDLIEQNSVVNHGDRNKLKKYAVQISGEVARHAATKNLELNQRMTAIEHYVRWPDEVKAYLQANMTDHHLAETLKDKMISEIKGLVAVGSITPHQGATQLALMSQTVDHATEYYGAVTDPNTGAHEVAGLTSDPIYNNMDKSGLPMEGNTQWLIDHHNKDGTLLSAQNHLMTRQLIPMNQYLDLEPAQQQKLTENKLGVADADAMINSGTPYPVIKHAQETMNEEGQVLSERGKFFKDALNQYVNDLQNGNFNSILMRMPVGQRINNEFQMRHSAIEQSNLDPEHKAAANMANVDQAISQRVSAGRALHIPDEYINPIPEAMTAQVQASFDAGGDPATIRQQLDQLSPQNQHYLARTMKTPEQQLMVSALSLSGNNIAPSEKDGYINANKNKVRYMPVDKAENPDDTDSKLNVAIMSKLAPQIRTINQTYPPEKALQYQNALIDTTRNYAKYLASTKSTLPAGKQNIIEVAYDYYQGNSTSSFNGQVNQAAKIGAASFEQLSNTNYVVNKKALPQGVGESDLDVMSSHIIQMGYQHILQNVPEHVASELKDRNPLSMRITPTMEVQAVDSFNNVVYRMPYTSNLPETARHEHEEKEKAIAQAKKDKENAKRRLRIEHANRQPISPALKKSIAEANKDIE
jgi:hypothetical protein